MELRDFQKTIAAKARDLIYEHQIAYLAMEVRVGKTHTAFEICRQIPEVNSVLFVTKKKAIPGLEKDWELYRETFKPTYMLKFINYESIPKLVEKKTDSKGKISYYILEAFWDLFVLDECVALSQYPKAANKTQMLKVLCEGRPIIYMSGTPNPESYTQLFFQFWVSSFSPWKRFRNFYQWSKEFTLEKYKYVYGNKLRDYSHGKKDEILAECQHLMLTYSQKEAGFTQDVVETKLYVDIDPRIHKLIKILQRDLYYKTKAGDVILADSPVKLQSKMHQLYSGTFKSEPEQEEKSKYVILDPTKAKFIKKYFVGKKIAIFYCYIAEGTLLRQMFPQHTDSPVEFNERSDLTFICQIVSGREGINLSTAEYLVMYNIAFSATSYWQGRARMQTKDRTMPARLCWIFAKGGIEDKIYEVLRKKKNYTLHYFNRQYPSGREQRRSKSQGLFDEQQVVGSKNNSV